MNFLHCLLGGERTETKRPLWVGFFKAKTKMVISEVVFFGKNNNSFLRDFHSKLKINDVKGK